MRSCCPVGDWVFVDGGPDPRVQHIAFESFGVRVRVTGDDPQVFERLMALLPPHAQPCPLEAAGESFGIRTEPDGGYRFERGNYPVARKVDLHFALTLMEAQLRIYVGMNTPGKVFVHAGVVEHRGSALVIPGLSFTGKTTLVTALVEAGARYYSDDFAVIDEGGLVHPFAKPLSIRDQGAMQNDRPVERLGGIAGDRPVPIGAVVLTAYRPGARWRPTPISQGRGVLGMLEHTLPARERARESLRIFNGAVRSAVCLEGERGEASDVVGPLLEIVGRGLAQVSARDAR